MANGTQIFLSEDQRQILRKSALCAKLNDEQSKYFFEVVERTLLDPFTGQIRPDVRKTTNSQGQKEPTLLIITTLQGLRVIGERSGQHDGESPPEWCDKEGIWRDVWLADFPPVAARACVFRKDRPRPQCSVVRWDAFVQLVYDQHGNAVPNPFWKRMGSHMLAKCALAGGYRGAYPNQCSGLYIPEELAEELDRDSEEAIEAEMIRRARAEKEYWDGQKAKGVFPVGTAVTVSPPSAATEQKPAERKKEEKSAEPPPKPAQATKPPPLVLQPELVVVSNEPAVNRLARVEVPLVSPLESAQPAPELAWRNFTITRLETFKGRTIGSLTDNEVKALKGFMGKLEASWHNIDEGLKTHYMALKERIDYDNKRELAALSDDLDLGPNV